MKVEEGCKNVGFVDIQIFTYVPTYVYTYLCVYLPMCVPTYVCTYLCMYIPMCVPTMYVHRWLQRLEVQIFFI